MIIAARPFLLVSLSHSQAHDSLVQLDMLSERCGGYKVLSPHRMHDSLRPDLPFGSAPTLVKADVPIPVEGPFSTVSFHSLPWFVCFSPRSSM
jgi:hypothetical protein